jgi:hypothetical protein
MKKAGTHHVNNEPDVDKEASGTGHRLAQIKIRPDGYFWETQDGKQAFGPFESLELALANMSTADEQAPMTGETLQEAEGEIGIADWIDPETGEPAEGQSPPRLGDE